MANSYIRNGTDRGTRQMRPATRDSNQQHRVLLDRLQMLGFASGGPLKTVGITSSRPGEGVTTVACNLALFASSCVDLRVLIVDANFSRPSLHQLFAVSQTPGLADLFNEDAIASDCIHDLSQRPLKAWPAKLRSSFRRARGISRLRARQEPPLAPLISVLPLGHNQIGSANYFDREDDVLLDNVRDDFDLVIIDLPAMGSATNRGFKLSKVDGILVVLEAEKTSDMRAQESLAQIKKEGGNLLGVVFNKCRDHLPRWIDRKLGD